METLTELNKKFNNLRINLLKICGYLVDNEIDKALETEDFNFISSVLFDYFEEKDAGYILTKFKESGLDEKVDDIDFSLDEWFQIQSEIKEEHRKIKESSANVNIEDKDEYIMEMIKKRKEKE